MAGKAGATGPVYQPMGCARRGLVALLALGFLGGGAVLGAAGIRHGLETGKQDDVYAGLVIGGLLLIPGLILSYIAARGRYKVTADEADAYAMSHMHDIDID